MQVPVPVPVWPQLRSGGVHQVEVRAVGCWDPALLEVQAVGSSQGWTESVVLQVVPVLWGDASRQAL